MSPVKPFQVQRHSYPYPTYSNRILQMRAMTDFCILDLLHVSATKGVLYTEYKLVSWTHTHAHTHTHTQILTNTCFWNLTVRAHQMYRVTQSDSGHKLAKLIMSGRYALVLKWILSEMMVSDTNTISYVFMCVCPCNSMLCLANDQLIGLK